MSIRALATVLDFAPQHWTTGTRMVAIALADHVNHDGQAWPSIDTLARRAGVSPRMAQYHLRQIEADGWITRTPRLVDRRQRANLWTWRMWITLPGVQHTSPQGCNTLHPSREGEGCNTLHPEPSSTNHQQNQRRRSPQPVDN